MVDKKVLNKLDDDFAFCETFIEHAQCLGYLGEGSTKGMSEDALIKIKSSRELIKKVWALFPEVN